ncbi:MAG: hypothetical protein DF168_02033 [Candidatus Moanabacter tarae]|uniref:Spermatogenesis-associated protein 20-like TRX domain-containing protein n=1 Tax=Candidatus Moanibacter tarae TaxID=2200854 RepID=A0A2Z4ART2_9BACT|nr:MAG: hypothetical protein DF168_02033 [Candidatus Moanabacter tarae]|tara:strand:- start:9930 stop:10841 length:912 start_codon:yes stop_codon:yes gene_type:complete
MDPEVNPTPNSVISSHQVWILALAFLVQHASGVLEGSDSQVVANRLIREKSPYLLQHAFNPVDWYPWGEEAFEDSETASLMNRHFINIKVDREERPDIDSIYMRFVQATTGSGGWPMKVWLTPDLKLVLGGNYFPPENRWGKPGFPVVLNQVATLWESHRGDLEAQAEGMVQALRKSALPTSINEQIPDLNILEFAYSQYAATFDSKEGGFDTPPQIILAGRAKGEKTSLMLKEIFHHYIPNKVVLLADGASGQEYLSRNLGFFTNIKPTQDSTTTYFCENYTCQLPTRDVAVLKHLLNEHKN